MSAGRPIEFDPDEALEQAMCLFWRKGYEATSLQDLLDAMALSKSSFYQSFHSKHALFENCIRLYRDQSTSQLKEKLAGAVSARGFIAATLHGIADETTGPRARLGCLLMNTASEFAQTDPAIAALVSDGIKALTDIFEQAVRLGQQQSDIARSQYPRVLAGFLVTNAGGLRNMVKAGADAQTVKQIADVTLAALG